MSLLDDVSIVVTPNGYKAGELYAVIPVPTEGAELVVNGDFATDSNWNKEAGWSISGGKLIANTSSVTACYQVGGATPVVAGKQYKVQFEITDYTNGAVSLRAGTTGAIVNFNTIGVHSTTMVAGGAMQIRFSSTGVTSLSIDNVSVKEYTSADMDVTRATAATRVDENGLVNYAEVIGSDLVTCGDFECAVPLNSWTTGTGWSISGGKAIFSGSNFSNLEPSTTIVVVGNTYKLNLIAEVTNGSFKVQNTGNPDLISESSSGTYSVVFTATSTLLTIARASVGIQNDFTIDNVSVKEVTRDNVPRIDYTGGGCPHILAEPQRTNLITYSEDFTDSSWSTQSATVTPNSTTSPSGELNADKITKDGSNANDRIKTDITVSNSTVYNVSAFLKNSDIDNGGVSTLSARISGGTLFRQGYEWNGSTLSVTSSQEAGTRTNVLLENFGNDWWKVGFSFTTDGTTAGVEIDIDRDNGTDTTAIFAWGVQLEAGSYATSYIPTSGSSVTRNQDQFTRDGIGSLINSTEGTFFVESAALANDLTWRNISLSDGTGVNRILLQYTVVSNQISIVIIENNNAAASLSYISSDITLFAKVAIKYKENDVALWVNGVEIATDTSAVMPTGLNVLAFNNAVNNDDFYAKVKQVQVYDTSLSDNQLIQLTGEAGTHFFESYAEMASALTYTIQ